MSQHPPTTAPGIPAPRTIDPRGPRFGAIITSLLLLAALFCALLTAGGTTPLSSLTLGQRAAEPGFLLGAVVAALFAWSLISPKTQPVQAVFRRIVRPQLSPPEYLEDARPPQFAQAVGLTVVTIGLVLHLLAVPWGLVGALALAFVAAGLNATIGWCMGCEMYLLLTRLRRPAPATTLG